MPTKSADHRNVYANAVGIGFNGTEARLQFGIRDDLAPPEDNEQHTTVFMAPQTVKVLSYMLSAMLTKFEIDTGLVIPIDPAQKAIIDAAVESAKRNP